MSGGGWAGGAGVGGAWVVATGAVTAGQGGGGGGVALNTGNGQRGVNAGAVAQRQYSRLQ